MTHAKLKLSQHPVRAGTRAEYTASLSTSEKGQVMSRPELPVVAGSENTGDGLIIGRTGD